MDRLRLVGASGAGRQPDRAIGPEPCRAVSDDRRGHIDRTAGATSCVIFNSFARLIATGLVAGGDAAVLIAAGDAACRSWTCTDDSCTGDNESADGRCVFSGDGAAFVNTCTGDSPSRHRDHHAGTITSGDAHANCADGRHRSPSGTTAGAGPVRSPLGTSPRGASEHYSVGAPSD